MSLETGLLGWRTGDVRLGQFCRDHFGWSLFYLFCVSPYERRAIMRWSNDPARKGQVNAFPGDPRPVGGKYGAITGSVLLQHEDDALAFHAFLYQLPIRKICIELVNDRLICGQPLDFNAARILRGRNWTITRNRQIRPVKFILTVEEVSMQDQAIIRLFLV